MFLEALPKRKLRRCLHCNRKFASSCAGERVCSKCRRKHNKLLARYGGVVTFDSTPQMTEHLNKVIETTEIKGMISIEKIDVFLSGGDVDDSAVYVAIQQKEKHTATVIQTKAVFLLTSILKEEVHVKKKRIRIFHW